MEKYVLQWKSKFCLGKVRGKVCCPVKKVKFCRGLVSFALEKYVLPWKSKFYREKVKFYHGKVKFCRGKVGFAVEK